MRNRRGGALLATIVICVLLLSVTFTYFNWSWTKSQENVHDQAIQRAVQYAESGIQAAEEQLMRPDSSQDLNCAPRSGNMMGGRFEYAISCSTGFPATVDATSTGYYYMARGAFVDPSTHKRAQRSVIHAVLNVERIDTLMIAVPNQLRVNPGANVGGAIYADDLVFVKGGADAVPAQVLSAAYSHSLTGDDGTPETVPSYAVFVSSPQKLGFPVRLPRLTDATRAFYKLHAMSPSSQLDDGSNMDGFVDAPQGSDFPVYFCKGDLHIGKRGVFNPRGQFVVYVTGTLHLHNSMSSDIGWPVFMAEKGIQIENDSPSTLVLQGSFITNGSIVSIPTKRKGELTVNGCLIAGSGLDLAAGWTGNRNYLYRKSYSGLPLPHLIEVKSYEVVQGKHR